MKTLLTALVAGTALTLAGAAAANAATVFALSITDGVHTSTVTDNGSGDGDPTLGSISAGAITVGNFTATVLGASNFSTNTLADIDLIGAVKNNGTGSGTVTVTLTLTNVGTPGNGPLGLGLEASGSIGGTNSNTTTRLVTAGDGSNTPFAAGFQFTDSGTLGAGGAFSANNTSSPFGALGPYDITEIVTISFNGAGHESFDAEMSIPEPATALVFGAALVGLGLGMRRRKRG
ncbi:MAG TPA: PEP-CTERM sorting domain-containing protein [Candidatus Cybelea sp.]|nr:PEP-CTERM sorting domain-containing protein [Candidatus Cybelea sp.]